MRKSNRKFAQRGPTPQVAHLLVHGKPLQLAANMLLRMLLRRGIYFSGVPVPVPRMPFIAPQSHPDEYGVGGVAA